MKRTTIEVTPQTAKLNSLIWAFDFATQYKHDKEADLNRIVVLATQHRLYGLADSLAAFVPVKPKRSQAALDMMTTAITLAQIDERSGVESDEYNEMVQRSLDAAQAAGWDWESDLELSAYCLKATPRERSEATRKAYLEATA